MNQREAMETFVVGSLHAGGPGSGRHKTVFDLTDKATGNRVHDAMKSLGYVVDMSKRNLGLGTRYTHPDGHEAQHIDMGYKGNQLKVHAIGSDPEDHFADVERILQERGLA